MKKLLSALTAGLFILGCNQAAEALDVDFVSDVSIASHGVTIGLDQDGDEFSVGAAGLTVSTSDTSQIGIEYASAIWGVTGSASYSYTSDDEHELGFDTSTSLLGVDLDAGVDWNITRRWKDERNVGGILADTCGNLGRLFVEAVERRPILANLGVGFLGVLS